MPGSVTIAEVELKGGIAEAAAGLASKDPPIPPKTPDGIIVELLRAGGGGEQEQREAQQEPAGQAWFRIKVLLLRGCPLDSGARFSPRPAGS